MRRRGRFGLLCAATGACILDARVLVLMAVNAQELPIGAIGRVVVVVAVPMVHGELAQPFTGELASTPGADVRQ